MGFFDFYKKQADHTNELESLGFKASDCDQVCDSCTSKFPSSINLAEASGEDLWGTTKPYGLHIVIPTNKADWPHDAISGSGPLAQNIDRWASNTSVVLGDLSKVKVTVSSLSSLKLESDNDYMDAKKGDILLLPFFVWVKNLKAEQAAQVLDSIVPKLVEYRDKQLEELPATLNILFLDVVVEADINSAYIFLCSHRTRDKKCGVTVPIMKKEMDLHLRDLGLYRDFGDERNGGVLVSYVNHIGGHKYAANVIIYIKKTGRNIWLARCKPNNVVPIINECIINDGKVWPEKVRQVQKFKPIDW